MAPAASITVVCPTRAVHPALRVRLVKVTPAANAREPGRWHRTQPRALGHMRAKMQSDRNARIQHMRSQRHAHTHGHARTGTRTRTCSRAYAHTSAYEHTHIFTTHTHAHTHAQSHPHAHVRCTHTRAHRRTGPRTQLPRGTRRRNSRENSANTTPIPRRHRVDTARVLCRVPDERFSVVA
jgi:hypothetical protein